MFHCNYILYLIILFYSLVIEPNFEKGISNGSVVINVIRDELTPDLKPVVFDLQGIDILETTG